MKRKFNTFSQIQIKNKDTESDFHIPMYQNRKQTSETIPPEQKEVFDIGAFGSSAYYYKNTLGRNVEVEDLYDDGDEPTPVEKKYIYVKGEDSDVDFDLMDNTSADIIQPQTNLIPGRSYSIDWGWTPEPYNIDIFINETRIVSEYSESSYSFTLTEDMSVNNKVVITVKKHTTPGEKVTLTYAMGEFATGGSVPSPVTVDIDTEVTVSVEPHPTRENYIFLGWSYEDGTDLVDFANYDKITMTGDITLYPAFADEAGTWLTFDLSDSYRMEEGSIRMEMFNGEGKFVKEFTLYTDNYDTTSVYIPSNVNTFTLNCMNWVRSVTDFTFKYSGMYGGNQYTNSELSLDDHFINHPSDPKEPTDSIWNAVTRGTIKITFNPSPLTISLMDDMDLLNNYNLCIVDPSSGDIIHSVKNTVEQFDYVPGKRYNIVLYAEDGSRHYSGRVSFNGVYKSSSADVYELGIEPDGIGVTLIDDPYGDDVWEFEQYDGGVIAFHSNVI